MPAVDDAALPDVRRLFELVEPIGTIPFGDGEPADALLALGLRGFWDTYFAGRAAPLGLTTAEVVDAVFYNFAPGEVARHIPRVWEITTPEQVLAVRQPACSAMLRRLLGDAASSPEVGRAADLLMVAATSAPWEGRPMYAALRAMPEPDDVTGRLFHAATMLREHRGDGHNAVLMVAGIGRLEAHVVLALAAGIPAHQFGRIHHLPKAQIDEPIDQLRARGLIGDDGWLSAEGAALNARIERQTDELAAPPYACLADDDRAQLIHDLETIAAILSPTP